jgi:prephenate dehydrogenase
MNAAKKVGIIGIAGKYGQWLKSFFESLGCEVIGADTKITAPTNQWVVAHAEVVIFAVDIDATAAVINALAPFSRPEQLWLDVTSLKVAPVRAMLNSRAEVVGLHPMCAPTTKGWRGQTVVVCLARCARWRDWVMAALTRAQAVIKYSDPATHDAFMANVQGLPHACALIIGAVLRRRHVSVAESLTYTSPFYRIAWSLTGRILHQNPKLYADIQMLNPNIAAVLEMLEEEVKRFREMVAAKDEALFTAEFQSSAEHFGEQNHQNASALFDRLIKFMADLAAEHAVMLTVAKDEPGILHRIAGIFADEGVNLTAFHSFPAAAGYSFWIGFDMPASSPPVARALQRIQRTVAVEAAS